MLQLITDQGAIETRIVSTLTRLRQEWQEATERTSLLEADGNIGFILADLINGFELKPNEQRQILGNELFQELKDILYSPKEN